MAWTGAKPVCPQPAAFRLLPETDAQVDKPPRLRGAARHLCAAHHRRRRSRLRMTSRTSIREAGVALVVWAPVVGPDRPRRCCEVLVPLCSRGSRCALASGVLQAGARGSDRAALVVA